MTVRGKNDEWLEVAIAPVEVELLHDALCSYIRRMPGGPSFAEKRYYTSRMIEHLANVLETKKR